MHDVNFRRVAREESAMAPVFLDVKRVIEAVLRRLDAEQVSGAHGKET